MKYGRMAMPDSTARLIGMALERLELQSFQLDECDPLRLDQLIGRKPADEEGYGPYPQHDARRRSRKHCDECRGDGYPAIVDVAARQQRGEEN